MSYHPAIGDIRSQLLRVVLIAAMLAAAATLLVLGAQSPTLPSERWYRLSSEQVMQADLVFRLGTWLQELGHRLPSSVQRPAALLTEAAVATYERQALADGPNPAAAYRLGVIYGHRGYREQADDYFAEAAIRDKGNSDLYYALSQVYSDEPGASADEAAKQRRVLADQVGWLADITLCDYYKGVADKPRLQQCQARQARRTHLFGMALGLLGLGLLCLLSLGLIVLAVVVARVGLRLSSPRPRLPFLVPWTFIDVAEIVALLPFAMVAIALGAAPLWHLAGAEEVWHLPRPLLMMAQYLCVGAVCSAVIFRRVRARSSRPARSLGLRARRPLRLIGLGVTGYAVFVAILFLAAGALRGVLVDVTHLAGAAERLIGTPRSAQEIVVYFVLVCILAPIVEETIFRGYVYAGIRRLMRPSQAMLVGGLLFWLAHLNPDALVVITLIGIALCYLYERTRSLLPGMIAHGLHNGLVLAALLVHSI